MSRCPGCGGVIGIDCFNPQECVNIGHAIEEDHIARRERDYSQQIESLQKQLESKDQKLSRQKDEYRVLQTERNQWYDVFISTQAELSRLKVIAESLATALTYYEENDKPMIKQGLSKQALTAYAEYCKEK